MSGLIFRRITISILLILLFGVAPTIYFITTTPYSYGFYTHWIPCFSYIDEGTFWSGQPYCESGGPLLFLVPYVFYKLSGESFFQGVMFFITVIINIMLFYVGILILKKEEVKDEISIYLFIPFFLSLVYFNTLSRFDNSFSILFFVLSCYWLKWKSHSEKRSFSYRYGIAGFFFAIAALTKVTTMLPFVLFVLWYLLKDEKHLELADGRIKVYGVSSLLKKLFFIFTPTALLYLFFQAVYPNLYKYVFLLFVGELSKTVTYSEVFRLLFFFSSDAYSLIFLPLLFIIFYGIFCFVFQRSILSWLLGPALLGYTILMVHNQGTLSSFRYWLPFLYFVPIFLLSTYKKNIMYTSLFSCLVFLLLLFPTGNDFSHNTYVSYNPFTYERAEFIKLLHPYFKFFSEEERVLVEFGENPRHFFKEYGINLPLDHAVSLNRGYGKGSPDANVFPRYILLFGNELKFDISDISISPKEQMIVNEILADNFSLVYYGPPDWATTTRIIKSNQQKFSAYCSFIVPSNVWLTTEGRHDAVLYFRDKARCFELFNKTILAYANSFNTICEKDEFSANITSKVLQLNRIPFDLTCTSGKQGLSALNVSKPTFYFYYLIIFGGCFFTLLLFIREIPHIPSLNMRGLLISLILLFLGLFIFFSIKLMSIFIA